MHRRALLLKMSMLGCGLCASAISASPERGEPRPLRFPADFGAHPEARIEWWYATGWLEAEPRLWGFQITFFRAATGISARQPSRFAASQLIFAHAALTDFKQRRLRHDERIARSGFGIAEAATGDTHVALRDWTLDRESGVGDANGNGDGDDNNDTSSNSDSSNSDSDSDSDSDGVTSSSRRSTNGSAGTSSRYRAHMSSSRNGFGFDLSLATTQPLLLQGIDGLSQKGPRPEESSRYYSQPQLAVKGSLRLDGKTIAVHGRAWLDHEWSDSFLDPAAVGWDWIGMNLADGSALTAFRLRRRDGSALYAGGSFRKPGEPARNFAATQVRFTAGRLWTSAASKASYPVEWTIETPAGRYTVRALLDDQELDSRASTGAIYWEGLSDLFDARGERVGRGYLEMTGYAAPLVLT